MTNHAVVIACAAVIEEMLPLMPDGMEHRILEFGFHVYPDKLRTSNGSHPRSLRRVYTWRTPPYTPTLDFDTPLHLCSDSCV